MPSFSSVCRHAAALLCARAQLSMQHKQGHQKPHDQEAPAIYNNEDGGKQT